MAAAKGWSARWAKLFGREDAGRADVLDVLYHRYVRERQHAMRYSQHAERMHYPQFHHALRNLATEEEKHAGWIAAKIKELGGKLPQVIPIHVPNEHNSWHYLRTDLEEEQRCVGELEVAAPMLAADFPEVAELLERIEYEGRSHRTQIRDMLARSDPQAAETP